MTSSHDSSRAQNTDPCPAAGVERDQVSLGFEGQVSTGFGDEVSKGFDQVSEGFPNQVSTSFEAASGWYFERPAGGRFSDIAQALTDVLAAPEIPGVSGGLVDPASSAASSPLSARAETDENFLVLYHYHHFATRGPTKGNLKSQQTPKDLKEAYITIDEARDRIEAFLLAEKNGTPTNAHVTFTVDGSGSERGDVKRLEAVQKNVLGEIRGLFRKARHPIAFIWSRETAETGLHFHLLVHVDPTRWLKVKEQLSSLMTASANTHGIKPRFAKSKGREWKVFKITPPGRNSDPDEPAGIQARLRLLGYLLKGIDPTALVETSDGLVPFGDLMAFYLDLTPECQGTIRTRKRTGKSQELRTDRWGEGLDPLDWIERVNQLLPEECRLPGPEFVAEIMGPGSEEPSETETLERQQKIKQLRQKCLDNRPRLCEIIERLRGRSVDEVRPYVERLSAPMRRRPR